MIVDIYSIINYNILCRGIVSKFIEKKYVRQGNGVKIKMEIKQLTTFSVIAKTGNFSEAAKILGYAQPTVTTHIQSLEAELNVKLFERLGHRVKLTPQGKRLLCYSEHILKYSSEAITELSSNGTIAGKISVGANESFSVVRLPDYF